MRAAAERRGRRPRVLYTDLDGTLLGPGGSLFAGSSGVTDAAASALTALHRAGIEVVPLSGRTEEQVREVARLLGATSFIAELGGIVWMGERIARYGAHPGPGTPYEAMARSGAVAFLLERSAGRLEPHAPWAFRGREVTMLLRGHVDPSEANTSLAEAGYGWLRLVDNGQIPVPGPTDVVHAYHLAPEGVTKADAVAEHLRRRGLHAGDAVAIGDAPADAAVADHVDAVYIVANGAASVEAAGAGRENVYVTPSERGEGRRRT